MNKLFFPSMLVVMTGILVTITGCVNYENTDQPVVDSDNELSTQEKTVTTNEIEWLTYEDDDVSFIYPKTFFGTDMEESKDQVQFTEEWSVERDGNVIYIRPDFESPAAEFGSTFEIAVYDDAPSARKEWDSVAVLHDSSESAWGNDKYPSGEYLIGVLENVNLGMGRIMNVYSILPEGTGMMGESLTPDQKHALVYASAGVYESYVTDKLIPGLQFKDEVEELVEDIE